MENEIVWSGYLTVLKDTNEVIFDQGGYDMSSWIGLVPPEKLLVPLLKCFTDETLGLMLGTILDPNDDIDIRASNRLCGGEFVYRDFVFNFHYNSGAIGMRVRDPEHGVITENAIEGEEVRKLLAYVLGAL